MSLNSPPKAISDRAERFAGKAGGGPAGFLLLALIVAEYVGLAEGDKETLLLNV